MLAVGTTASVALLCLAHRLAASRDAFPGVALRIETGMALVDPAAAGLDCCLRYGPGHWPGVVSERLAGEDLFPVCAPDILPPSAFPIDVAALSGLPLAHDLGPVSWVEWLAAFGAPPPGRSEALAVTDSALAQRAAVDGIGVALGRSRLAGRDLAAGCLVRPVPQSMPSPFGYFLVRPQRRDGADALVDGFRDWLLMEVFA